MKCLPILALLFCTRLVSAQQLEETVISILSVNAVSDNQDLAAIAAKMGNARLIGLGEATHGTHEFFEFKRRFIQYMVEQGRCKVIFMEAFYNSSEAVNQYIVHGNGDIEGAMQAIGFEVYQTEEVKGLLEWLKSYNQRQPYDKRVRFFGADMQWILDGGKNLRALVLVRHPGLVAEFDAVASPFYSDSLTKAYNVQRHLQPGQHEQNLDRLEKVKAWFASHGYFQAAEADMELRLALRQLEAIEQALGFQASLQSGWYAYHNFRDSCMAANIKFVMDNMALDGTTALLWAHNQHMAKDHPVDRMTPMGKHLALQLSNDYYAAGFVFREGSFRALIGPKSLAGGFFKRVFAPKKLFSDKRQTRTLKPLKGKNSLCENIKMVGNPDFFLHFDDNPTDVRLKQLATSPQEFYEFGSNFTFLNTNKHLVPSMFDGIFYFSKTTAAKDIQ